jgi:hypothetical protein
MKGQTCPDITNLKLRVKVCAQEREHREFYLSINSHPKLQMGVGVTSGDKALIGVDL